MEFSPMSGISEDLLVSEQTSIAEAFHKLNANKKGIIFVLDAQQRVAGCATDGDIRRQLLVDGDLGTPLSVFMNRDFARVAIGAPREQVLKLLDNGVHVVPMLDGQGRLAHVCTRDEFHLQDEDETFARSRSPA